MSRRVFWLLLASVVIIGLLVVVAVAQTPDHKITIAVTKQPVFSLFYIAQSEGYFRDENVDVGIKSFDLGRDALDDMVSGGSDITLADDAAFVKHALAGADVKALASLYRTSANTEILAKRGRVKSPQDLAGAAIALFPGTDQEFYLKDFLKGEGVSAEGIRKTDYDLADFESVALRNDVDAVVVWEPYGAKLLRKYPRVFTAMHSDLFVQNAFLVARGDVLSRNPEAVRRFMAALLKAQDFVASHPEQAIAAVAQNYPEFEVGDVAQSWAGMAPALELGNQGLQSLSNEAQDLDPQAVSGSAFDFQKYVDSSFLREFSPESVTLL